MSIWFTDHTCPSVPGLRFTDFDHSDLIYWQQTQV